MLILGHKGLKYSVNTSIMFQNSPIKDLVTDWAKDVFFLARVFETSDNTE